MPPPRAEEPPTPTIVPFRTSFQKPPLSARLPLMVLAEMDRSPAATPTAPPRPRPASVPNTLATTFEPPRDRLPLNVLPAIVRVGLAVVKKAPLPIAPPV